MTLTLPSLAQEKVTKGMVVSSVTGEPIEGVVVTAQGETSDKILAYSMTGAGGTFVLSIPEAPSKIRVTASSMMTESLTETVGVGRTDIVLKVKEKARQLKEVRLTAQKLTMKGDTLNYNVSSFAKSDDRSIGEVLKRLPGIKVVNTGEIYYQGKEINKFYVEGMDLLQGRYGLATNNIDPKMVATVQVLENHQPIKILEGSELPEQAAINIKLRQSALGAFFLTAQAGIGASPLLLSNEVLGMRFTGNQQNMVMYKNDNTGRDIAKEMTSFYGLAAAPLMNPFSIESLSSPSIDQQHYLFNNSHVISLNDLHALKSGFTMTTNLNYLYDRQKKDGMHRQTVIDPVNGDIIIVEDVSSRLLKKELAGTVTLEKNEKQAYVTNRTDANVVWNSQRSALQADTPVAQSLNLPSFSVENKFKSMHGNDRWSSNFLLSRQNYTLDVSPVKMDDLSALDDKAFQNLKYLQMRLDASYWRRADISRRLELNFSVTPSFTFNRLTSAFFSGLEKKPVTADSLSNRFNRSELSLAAQVELSYKRRSLTTRLRLGGDARMISRNNQVLGYKENKLYFIPDPGLTIEYKKRSLLYRADVVYRQSVSGINNDLSGYMMSSYRAFSRNDGALPKSDRAMLSGLVSFKNVGTAFFASLQGVYEHSHKNTISSMSFHGTICNATNIKYSNDSDSWYANLELGTDIRVLATTLKFDASLSGNCSVALYQGRVAGYDSKSLTLTPSIFTVLGKIATFSYDAQYRYGRNRVDGSKSSPTHYLKQSAEISIIPFKNFSVNLSGDHYYNNLLKPNPSTWFGNVGLKYKYKKLEVLLDWTNVFNTKRMVSYYYDEISSYYSAYTLRPSEILLRVRFSIL